MLGEGSELNTIAERDIVKGKARELDCAVVYPEAAELQLDLDDEESFVHFQKQRERLRVIGVTFNVEVSPSKSGLPHRHVSCVFRNGYQVTALERIAFQYFLGSDKRREDRSMVRFLTGDRTPTLFFEPDPKLQRASAERLANVLSFDDPTPEQLEPGMAQWANTYPTNFGMQKPAPNNGTIQRRSSRDDY